MLALLALLAVQGSALRAESLLAAGDAYAAAQVMERAVRHGKPDAAAYLLLGRAHYARSVVGRYAALRAFRAAAHLAPDDPAPLYWQTEVGLYLGSDEGERIARDALIALFAAVPDYRDAWSRFRTLFGNADIWRRADAALARHPDSRVALVRRSELALRLEQPERATALLERAERLGETGVESLVLRAEARFLAGDPAGGEAWIARAVARAADDTSDALWDRFWPIASPLERATYDATAPSERPAFFTAFLDRRDPNLLTPENERLPEHFARLAYARRQFRLLHPLSQYHRSAGARARSALRSRELLAELSAAVPGAFLGTPSDRAVAEAGLGPDRRAITEAVVDSTTAYFLAGLDARGLIWVRHGPPQQRLNGTLDALRPLVDGLRLLDMESWVYDTPQGPVSLGFQRASGGAGWGDFLFEPMSARQLRWTRALLRTDHTSQPARLEAPLWLVFFRGAGGFTDVYARVHADTSALALWDRHGRSRARMRGAGVLHASAGPGTYDVGLDFATGADQGRIRGTLVVPDLAAPSLTLSSLLLGAAATLTDRDETLAAMPPDRTFAATGSLAAYAEVYHLRPDSLGLVRYRARYTIARERSLVGRLLHGSEPIVLEFDRETRAGITVAEQLVIDPGRLPAGRYRVSLEVTDLLAVVKSATAATEIVIR